MNVRLLVFCLVIDFVFGIDHAELSVHIKQGTVTAAWLEKMHVSADMLNTCTEPGSDTPLGVAIRERLSRTVQALLDAGASPVLSSNGLLPIEIAAQWSSVAIVKQLLRAGAALTPAACQYAPQKNDLFYFLIHLFKPLFVEGAENGDNPYGLTGAQVHDCLNQMLLQVRSEHQLRDLLRLGADVTYRDGCGWTALDHALAHCRWSLVTILRAQGAPAAHEAAVKEANAALYNDVHCLHAEDCPRALRLAHGKFAREGVYDQFINHVMAGTLTCDFMRTYFSGINKLAINRPFAQHAYHDALLLAVQAEHAAVVALLLRFGARVHGTTLAYAIDHASKEIVRLLLAHGALLHWVEKPLERIILYNPHAPELVAWLAPQTMRLDRDRAYALAQKRGLTEIAALLRDAGARV